MLEIVRENGRNQKENILPFFKELLDKSKIGLPVITNGYVERKEETYLIEKIEKEKVLLLTGLSQCGKSEIAKKTAFEFAKKGYDYLLTNEVEEMQRFFSSTVLDNKVGILEDTWGHSNANQESYDKWRKVEHLIKNLNDNHKLIITSRIEILYEIKKTDQLNKCKLANHDWVDLTIKDVPTLQSFWRNFSENKNLPLSIQELVSKNINQSNELLLLQIGQLQYLADQDVTELQSKKYPELESIARHNSEDIAQSIQEKYPKDWEIMMVLALCSNTIKTVPQNEIAYILSDQFQEVSIRETLKFRKDFVFPHYSTVFQLNKDQLHFLEELEERSFIRLENEEYYFTHPNYYEAGRKLFFPNSQSKQKRFLEYIKKGLACANPTTATTVARNLAFVYKQIDETHKQELINLGFYGLQSLFPAVVDYCAVFLSDLFEVLTGKEREKIIDKIQYGYTDKTITWHNQMIPIFVKKDSRGYTGKDAANFLKFWSDEEAMEKRQAKRKKIEKQFTENQYVSPYEAYYYATDNPIVLKALLQYDEAFIRTKAISYILQDLKEENKYLVNQIFEDEHYEVVSEAIETIMENYVDYSPENKVWLSEQIQKALNKSKAVCIRVHYFISAFGIVSGDFERDIEVEHRQEVWEFWVKTYQTILQNLPVDGLLLNVGNFVETLKTALKYVSVYAGIVLLETYYDYIDKNNIAAYFSGNLCDIANYLLRLTKNDYLARKTLFQKLIQHPNTDLLLSNLKSLSSYWESSLHDSEKEQIRDLLKSERADLRWIKATLLTTDKPPSEIVSDIFGNIHFFEKDIEEIVKAFPPQLLEDCLHFYFGVPEEPIFRLAFYGRNSSFWNKVRNYIVSNHFPTAFHLCFHQFLYEQVNAPQDWKNDKVVWEQLCAIYPDKELLTECLMYYMAKCDYTIHSTAYLWNTLIKSYGEQKDNILSTMVENIELLQYGDLGSMFLKFVNLLEDKEEILSRIYFDFYFMNLLLPQIEKVNLSVIIEQLNEYLSLNNQQLRLIKNIDTIKQYLDNSGNDILENWAASIDQIGEEKFNILEEKYKYAIELDNWVK